MEIFQLDICLVAIGISKKSTISIRLGSSCNWNLVIVWISQLHFMIAHDHGYFEMINLTNGIYQILLHLPHQFWSVAWKFVGYSTNLPLCVRMEIRSSHDSWEFHSMTGYTDPDKTGLMFAWLWTSQWWIHPDAVMIYKDDPAGGRWLRWVYAIWHEPGIYVMNHCPCARPSEKNNAGATIICWDLQGKLPGFLQPSPDCWFKKWTASYRMGPPVARVQLPEISVFWFMVDITW